jgi:hypothetical protein
MRFFPTVAFAILLSATSIYAQQRGRRLVNEVFMVSDGSAFGVGGGFGVGKNLGFFEFSREALGSHALGVGEAFYPNEVGANRFPISKSRQLDYTFAYQRDIINVRNGAFTPFAEAGFGIVRNHFNLTQPCGLFCPQGSVNTPPVTSQQHTTKFGPVFGGGFRLKVWRSIGIRADVKAWKLGEARLVPGTRGATTTRSETRTRATVGIYLHSRYNGWFGRQ